MWITAKTSGSLTWVLGYGGFFLAFNIKMEGWLVLRPCSNITENLAE